MRIPGRLTAEETQELGRRLTSWKNKHKKSWEQASRDFGVSRATLFQIRCGKDVKVETVKSICEKIGWRAFRSGSRVSTLWDPAHLQAAAAEAFSVSEPLLLLQVIHSATSTLHLRLNQTHKILTRLELPSEIKGTPRGRVILCNELGYTLAEVSFQIEARQLSYTLTQHRAGTQVVMGEGYVSQEGFAFCVEFVVSVFLGKDKKTGLAARKKVNKIFLDYHDNARRISRRG